MTRQFEPTFKICQCNAAFDSCLPRIILSLEGTLKKSKIHSKEPTLVNLTTATAVKPPFVVILKVCEPPSISCPVVLSNLVLSPVTGRGVSSLWHTDSQSQIGSESVTYGIHRNQILMLQDTLSYARDCKIHLRKTPRCLLDRSGLCLASLATRGYELGNVTTG